MERTDIHKDQLVALKELGAEQIIYDLQGVTFLLESIGLSGDSTEIPHKYDGLALITTRLHKIHEELRAYFKVLGEV